MKEKKERVVTIDAKGISFGRVCSQAAFALQSKNVTGYKPNVEPSVTVNIINAKLIRFSGKKLESNVLFKHSQYPGGLTKERLATKFLEKPSQVILKSVRLMLPKNRMQRKLLKKLKISL